LSQLGAHILWLPQSSAIEAPCNLAKLMVTVDLNNKDRPIESIFAIAQNAWTNNFCL